MSHVSDSDGDTIQKVHGQHKLLLTVLESRNMRLNVALTFWQKKDVTQFASFVIKADDDGLLVDVLPFMISSIKNEDEMGKLITMGICLEMLPQLEKLLYSKYEDYITRSLDFLRVVTQHWFLDFRKMKEDNDKASKSVSLSIQPFYLTFINMEKRLRKITTRKGNIGDKAKIVMDILAQIT